MPVNAHVHLITASLADLKRAENLEFMPLECPLAVDVLFGLTILALKQLKLCSNYFSLIVGDFAIDIFA